MEGELLAGHTSNGRQAHPNAGIGSTSIGASLIAGPDSNWGLPIVRRVRICAAGRDRVSPVSSPPARGHVDRLRRRPAAPPPSADRRCRTSRAASRCLPDPSGLKPNSRPPSHARAMHGAAASRPARLPPGLLGGSAEVASRKWGEFHDSTAREHLEHRVAQTLAALPPVVQVRLSGKPPVRIDGDTLAPEVQLTLALLERRRAPLETVSPAQARRARRRMAAVSAGRQEAVGAVRDVEIDSDVPLRARHYAPDEPGGPHPLLVFFHGGGFVFGDLDTHDGVCRLLCRHAGAHVLASTTAWRRSTHSRRPSRMRARRCAGHSRTRASSAPIR